MTDKTISIIRKNDDISISTVTGSNLELEANQKYTFNLSKLNDAYYGVDYNIIKTKKTISLGNVLSPYIPQSSTPVTPEGLKSYIKSTESLSNTSFFAFIDRDYEKLNTYYLMIDKNTDSLNKLKDLPSQCKTTAVSFIESASLTFNIKDTIDCRILNDSLDLTIMDLKNRIQLLRSNKLLKADAIGLVILQKEEFVTNHEKEMRTFIDVLAANQKATDTISSKPFNVNKADYLDVSFTIYGHKFADQKDTLLTQTLRFYRIHYVSMDVSAGFFGTNLLSQSYYFTDTVGNYTSESSNKRNLSVGALVQCNYAIGPGLKVGPCAGAAISIMDAKPQIFLGANIVIGRSTEFAISGGWAFSYLPVPSNVVKNRYVSTIEGSVPTYDKFVSGFFIGLTYNIIQR